MTPNGSVNLVEWMKTRGAAGIARELHPLRLGGRIESRMLYRRLLRDLARIWCGEEERVEELRDEALTGVLRHAQRCVPYYRRVFAELGIDRPRACDLRRLPLLEKSLVRAHESELHCVGWRNHPHYRQSTSGTTGEPLRFIVDNLAGVAAAAHQEFAFRLMGYRDGDRIAAFAGRPVPEDLVARNVFWAPRSTCELPYGRVCYATHYMDDRRLPYYLDDLDRAAYRLYLGYPSGIHAIARHCLRTGRRLRTPPVAVQLTSEVASEQQIADIAEAFGTRVFLQYGHAEASVYAHTWDAKHEYVCSPLMGFVEVLDDRGAPVAVGEEGEIVVTGLHARVMPFIRYRTGDRGVYGGERRGLTVLRTVLGRTADTVVLRDGTRTSATGLLLAPHLDAVTHIERWQVLQREAGKLIIRVIPRPTFREAHSTELKETYRRLAGVEAEVELVSELPRSAAGKHVFFVSDLTRGERARPRA